MLDSRISEIVASLGPEVAKAVEAGADLVAQSAKDRVPVDTGRLKDAIHVEPDPEDAGFAVVAGNNKVFYGNMVEHGGAVNRAPHPFLIPALEADRPAIEALIAGAVKKATSG